MNICRLMKASEVRKLCEELRNNPAVLMELERAAKEKIDQQRKMASAPTLAIAQ
jgi:hypothetical protein